MVKDKGGIYSPQNFFKKIKKALDTYTISFLYLGMKNKGILI